MRYTLGAQVYLLLNNERSEKGSLHKYGPVTSEASYARLAVINHVYIRRAVTQGETCAHYLVCIKLVSYN